MENGLRAAFIEMLPELQAEEELRAIRCGSAGAWPMQKDDRAAYLRRLHSWASSGPEPVRSLEALAAMGIEVVSPSG